MVIMIGDQIKRPQEMARWASIHQYTKKPMIYDLDSFDMFAHLAYYIHRGTLTTIFFPRLFCVLFTHFYSFMVAWGLGSLGLGLGLGFLGWGFLVKALAHYTQNCKKCSCYPYTLQYFLTTATIFTTTFSSPFFRKVFAVLCVVCTGF